VGFLHRDALGACGSGPRLWRKLVALFPGREPACTSLINRGTGFQGLWPSARSDSGGRHCGPTSTRKGKSWWHGSCANRKKITSHPFFQRTIPLWHCAPPQASPARSLLRGDLDVLHFLPMEVTGRWTNMMVPCDIDMGNLNRTMGKRRLRQSQKLCQNHGQRVFSFSFFECLLGKPALGGFEFFPRQRNFLANQLDPSTETALRFYTVRGGNLASGAR